MRLQLNHIKSTPLIFNILVIFKRVYIVKKIITVFAVLMAIQSTSSYANQYFRGRTITGVGVYTQGSASILLFKISGDISGNAPCAVTGRFSINSTSPNYKEMVSLVLSAYHSKENNVDINVLPSCSAFGNAQDVLGVKIGDMPW
jgi:hypothetical protein